MFKKITKTWKRLGLKQKWSLVGLLLLAISMPLTIVASIVETHVASQASEFSYQNRLLYKPNLLAPVERISPMIDKKFMPGVDGACRIGGCNGELCLGIQDPEIETMCVLRENESAVNICRNAYATCEVQASGTCGWSFDERYEACLLNGADVVMPEASVSTRYLKPLTRPTTCGNAFCEAGERNQELCTRSLPPRCKHVPGTCPQDCMDITKSPEIPTCALACPENHSLDPNRCLCEPIEEAVVPTPGVPSYQVDPAYSQACEAVGGVIREMKGCGDSCNTLTDQLVACPAGDPTLSCDCGPRSCWNGTTCVKNPRMNAPKDRLSLFGFQSWFGGVNSFFDSFFK